MLILYSGKPKSWGLVALFTLLLTFWHGKASAVFLSLESTAVSPSQGQQLTVDLWARDLGTDVVSGFDADLVFDPAALSFQSASFSSLLGDGIDSIQDATDFGNSINLAELSFLFESDLSALQSGADFILASVTFVIGQAGLTQLSISNSMVSGADPFTTTFSGPANSLAFNVSAAQVPEPVSSLLLLLGLCFVGLKKQRWSGSKGALS